MAILYISLIIDLAFVYNWFFSLFLGLQQCSIPHSQIYNFLIVWLRLLIFGMSIHQLIWNHCSWLFFLPVTLTFDPKVELLTNMKILYLAHNFFLFGFRLSIFGMWLDYTKLIYHMLLYVTLTFYFKVKLFIIWRFFFYISWHASPVAPVFSTNKTPPRYIEILLKVALNTINLNQSTYIYALIVIILSKY